MIYVHVSETDCGSNSQINKLMEPHIIYKAKVDISGVPRIFCSLDGGGGVYKYPEDDDELLSLCSNRSSPRMRWIGGKFDQTEIYHVVVEAESGKVEDFLKVLKGIGCESMFIACSVERANRFFAELNEDNATRLRDSSGISDVYSRDELIEDD
ncbi:hypothetical protein DCAR_0521782 [Daucus carota subsp. sativus]|uniref:Uncharacterized protein n=1 Tax=Daucus carota subsp. sativus TaxID=79200 RepID=A0AAF1B2Q3_DAUCS|nr:PREDICTED: uncharacterized protein LOC108224053 isoform X1 [Daucus carota subsp. sativus]XP_017254089.1 PREDICTED: uncharacterized protein LOC108224053 isoform X1 [Daucus carota subsp. sativus]XP_017254090.1 PREDICTED: uncharacterized protein LOC108224053 isoform X2 [Daucus carota subsp. sativus]WOH02393.1 hypothetical protein DCAR_0521782 [Daucus carota subsp. sativus]